MTHFIPVELDTTTVPGTNIPRRAAVGKTVDPSYMADATALEGGKMSAADKAALDAMPAAIAAAAGAVDAGAEHIANKNVASGYAGLNAQLFVPAARLSKPSVRNLRVADGQIDYVPSPVVRRAHPIDRWSFYCGDHTAPIVRNCTVISGGKLHRTDGFSWTADDDVKPGNTFTLQNLNTPANNIRIRVASVTAADITPAIPLTVDATATDATLIFGRSSGVRAGLIPIAPNDAGVANGPIHPDAGSYPFMTLFTSIDDNGYPAYMHKRLNSSNAGNDSGEDGYPNGLLITPGAFERGDGYDLRLRGKMKNTHSVSAFIEFAIEPNHVRGVFSGTSRARLLSGEIGNTWTGWIDVEIDIRWRYHRGEAWSAVAMMRGTKPGYGVVFERPCSAEVTAGVNLRTTLALLCHQFRVDNIANLDVYDDTYQGLGTLELVATHIDLQPVIGNR